MDKKPHVLVVVSHPDDEVLGCGGTAYLLGQKGWNVRSCILSTSAQARSNPPSNHGLATDIISAQKILGMGDPFLGNFPNIKLNTVPHLDLVQFIEQAICEHGAQIIFTHHPVDLNNDHRNTSRACQAAARLFQRKPNIPPLLALYFMEILSATDWTFPGGGNGFSPDTYFPIKLGVDKKISALAAYANVMRPFPHSRSEEVIRSLAAIRGAAAGIEYAEAFQTAFNIFGGISKVS